MSERRDEHVDGVKKPGQVSEGGVDNTTGVATGALAGAVLGAAGGPLGLIGGALVGGLIGNVAAAGPEHPYYPEPWLTRREQLHEHSKDEQE